MKSKLLGCDELVVNIFCDEEDRLFYHCRKVIPVKVQAKQIIMTTLKVSAKSDPAKVAGAIAGIIREEGKAEIQSIGAGSLNQAVKAVAIARGFVAPSGYDLIIIPAFEDIDIDGEERTAIRIIVEPR